MTSVHARATGSELQAQLERLRKSNVDQPEPAGPEPLLLSDRVARAVTAAVLGAFGGALILGTSKFEGNLKLVGLGAALGAALLGGGMFLGDRALNT